MLKESLIKEDESFSGLYYSFLIIFIMAFAVLFSMIVGAIDTSPKVVNEDWYILLSFAVSPIAIIFTTLFFAYLKGDSLVKICGWQKTEYKYYLIAVVVFVSVFFGLSNANLAFVEFLSDKLGYTDTEITLPSFSVGNYLLVVLTVCVLPAIAEEVAMRGIVLKGIKSGNVILNALIGGLLFSLFHMSPMQTIYQFAVGFVFSLIALKSGSTLPTILVHFLNNFAIITIEYFCPNVFANLGGWMLAITIPATICFVLVTGWLIVFDKDKKACEKGKLASFFLCAIAGIFICLFMWIASF